VSAWAGGTVAALLGAIALLHAYWALGGFWPGRDPESLARTVVGGPPGLRFPGPGATWAVVVVLAGAAVTVLAAAGLVALPVPAPWIRTAALAGAAILLVRGLEGFVDTRLRPDTVGSPFARLNRLVYSPLCLLLAALTAVAALRP
jgi:hypothetical protein